MVEVFPKDIIIRIRYHNELNKDHGPYLELYKLLENRGEIRHIAPLGYTSLSDLIDKDHNLSLESLVKEMKEFLKI